MGIHNRKLPVPRRFYNPSDIFNAVAIVDETLDMYVKTHNQVVVPKTMDIMADALRGAIASCGECSRKNYRSYDRQNQGNNPSEELYIISHPLTPFGTK